MNPEFKRNLWLEMSPTRLAIMPAVLALIGLLVYVLNPDDPQRSLFVAFSVLFVGLTVGWGSLLVVSSINNEVSERTWDQQRLSALSPWDMAWGKLFGSAAYAWYGSLLCALVAVVAALSGPAFWSRCVWLLVGAVGTVALHAWLMASRLHTLDIRSEKASGMAGRLFGVFLVLQTLPVIFMVLRDPSSPDREGLGSWWGWGLPLSIQSLLVALLLLALRLAGAVAQHGQAADGARCALGLGTWRVGPGLGDRRLHANPRLGRAAVDDAGVYRAGIHLRGAIHRVQQPPRLAGGALPPRAQPGTPGLAGPALVAGELGAGRRVPGGLFAHWGCCH